MKILDRLPIYEGPAIIPVGDEMIQVWQNQAIVWLSLQDALRPFPAILDTGHSHDLSISRRHLERWTGANLPQIGWTRIGMEKVPQYGTKVFLHRNAPGTRQRSGQTHPLQMDQGIAVVPDESRAAPRLPLLGMRALIGNRLRLIINGERRQVTLKTKGWF